MIDRDRLIALAEKCGAEVGRYEENVVWIKLHYPSIESLAAALSAEQPAGEAWQEIETAPKDTKARLVWCPEHRNIFAAAWDRNQQKWTIFGGDAAPLHEQVTHWMPLPPAPGASPIGSPKDREPIGCPTPGACSCPGYANVGQIASPKGGDGLTDEQIAVALKAAMPKTKCSAGYLKFAREILAASRTADKGE